MQRLQPRIVFLFALGVITSGSAFLPSVVPLFAAVRSSATASFRPRVFPNPWKVDKDNAVGMTFDQFPTGSTVKIFTIAAEKVRVLHTSAADVVWDLKNDDGDTVASGVYLYTVTAPSGDMARGKLVVIR